MLPDDALLAEFSSYYNGDELPRMSAFRRSIASRVGPSAARLRRAVGDSQIPSLISLLDTLARAPNHPLHGHIMNRTMIHWPDEPETWTAFSELAAALIAALKKKQPEHSS